MKEKIFNKLGDKALNQLVAELFSLVKTNRVAFLSFIDKVIENNSSNNVSLS
jgi:hypothetical protein